MIAHLLLVTVLLNTVALEFKQYAGLIYHCTLDLSISVLLKLCISVCFGFLTKMHSGGQNC